MDYVFIDSNIFIQYGLRFESGIFAELKQYCIDKKIGLIYSPVVISELKKNRFSIVNEAVNNFYNSKNKLERNYKISLGVQAKEELLARILDSEFSVIEKYFKDCKSHTLSFSNVDLEEIFEWYIKEEAPFEKNKKKRAEFKDAINIQLIKDLSRGEDKFQFQEIHIISNDGGVKESFAQLDGFFIYDRLFDFIKKIRKLEGNDTAISLALDRLINQEEFQIRIIEELKTDISYEVNLAWYDEVEIIDVLDIYDLKVDIVVDEVLEDNIKGLLYLDYEVEIEYKYFNPHESPYDPEDKVFLWRKMEAGCNIFPVSIEIPYTVLIDKDSLVNENIVDEFYQNHDIEIEYNGIDVIWLEENI